MCWDETSLGSCCSEAFRSSGAVKSGIVGSGLALLMKLKRIRQGLMALVLFLLEKLGKDKHVESL